MTSVGTGVAEQSWAELFWREYLAEAGTAPPVPLPGTRPPTPPVSRRWRSVSATLDKPATSALRTALQAASVSLETAAIGAWALWLDRHARRERVTLGMQTAGAASPVPVILPVDPTATLLHWLENVEAHRVAVTVFAPQAPRTAEGAAARPAYDSGLVLGGAAPTPIGDAPFTISVQVGAKVGLQLDYDAGRLDAKAASRAVAQWRAALSSIGRGVAQRIADLDMVPPKERALLLEEWSGGLVQARGRATSLERILLHARRNPDAPAVEVGDHVQTYGELVQRASRIARALRARGAAPGCRVGLCLERSVHLAPALLGTLLAGCAYVPLDPAYPHDRLAFLVEDAELLAILTEGATRAAVPSTDVPVLCLDNDTATLAQYPDRPPTPVAQMRDPAYVIYTSGSTGKPKGVVISHGAMTSHNLAVVDHFALDANDRALQFASISFDLSVEEIFPTWLAGGTLVLHQKSDLSSIQSFLASVTRRRLTVLNLPTAFWHELVHGLPEDGDVLPTVRLVLAGGEAASAHALARWRDVVGPRIRWINGYGPTEATVTATCFELDDDDTALGDGDGVPIGRPIRNTEVYVLDAQRRLAPVGMPGELYLGGAGIANGYLGRPALTGERFVPDPFHAGRRLYRTGDLVRFVGDGGVLEFLGRIDAQVKVRGFRIELGEVEHALEADDAVEQAVAIVHAAHGGPANLVAFARLAPGMEADSSTILGRLRDHLPAHMVPSQLTVLDRLPTTANGKVDRRALLTQADATTGAGPAPAAAAIEGLGPVERELLTLWRSLLNAPGLGPDDNFFAAGGNSLLAVRLFEAIEQRWERTLPLATLLRAPTVMELGLIVRQGGRSSPTASLVEIQPDGSRPPLFCLHSIGGDVLIYWDLAHQLDPDQPVLGLQMQGLYEHQQPDATIEACAARYVREIRERQPHGPYRLAGYSSGATLAFEVAQQLTAAGETVSLLASIDGEAPRSDARPTLRTPEGWFNVSRNLPGWLGDAMNRGPTGIAGAVRHRFRAATRRLMADSAQGGAVEIAIGTDLSDLSEHRRTSMNVHYHALDAYSARPWPGVVHVLRTRQRPLLSPLGDDLSWQPLCREVNVISVPGRHHDVLKQPAVAAWAGTMRQLLERSADKAPGS
ncbi:MAG: amino acid adenylation domain-containing protein [Planctomycetota bacterium]